MTVGALLRGPSAVSLSELSEASLGGTLADAAEVGEQLFGVAAVLRDQVALRRVLADGSVEGAAKAGLATTVFGSALRDDTLAVVTDAVQKRWTAPSHLATALDQLAVVAVVRSAGSKAGTVSDELFAVRQLVQANPALRSALSDVSRSGADRAALLHGLLDGKAQDATLRLVDRAVLAEANIDHTLDAYQQLAAGVQGAIVAVVHTARPLTESDQTRLVNALGKQYGATIHLHLVHEPDLIGGLRVEIADDVIDGTVVNRLDDARRRLVG